MSDGDGLSRRELLRRGAIAGGALAWAVPTVQTLGMGRALAAEPSGGCVLYCIKYEADEGRWTSLGSSKSQGNCFVCSSEAVNGLPPTIGQAVVSGTAATGFTVTLPPGCTVFDSASTGTPDELAGRSGVWVKCGSKKQGAGCELQLVDPGSTTFTVSPCGSGKAISHFELLIRCCD